MTKRFKIEPDLTCPELAGYKLPPCSRCQEDGVEEMAIDSAKILYEEPLLREEAVERREYINGFIDGYHKAREKFEFTEADINNALSYGYHTAKDELNGIHSTGYGTRFIQSIRTPRIPIAIEVEMVIEVEPNTGVEMGEYPATNPDGTVKGVYIFE